MKRKIGVGVIAALLCVLLCSCCFHKAEGSATCTEDKVCEKCGEVLEKATGHKPDHAATCTEDSVCTVCGAVLEKAKGHTPPASYACEDGANCTVCGAVLVAAGTHTPNHAATCTEDSVCTVCGAVLEKAKGHTPGPAATDTTAQTCTVCGAVLKKPLKSSSGSGSSSSNDDNVTSDVPPIPETATTGHYTGTTSQYNSRKNLLACGNYLMEYFGARRSGSSGYAEAVSAFAKKYPSVNVNCIIVPKCASFHSPADRTDQFENHKAFISATYAKMTGVKTPDAFGEMAKHRGEYLFYRTDHHWTSLGAYYASVAFCNANGITPRALSSYETVVRNNFMGTLYTNYWGSNRPSGIQADYTVGHLPKTAYTFRYATAKDATAGTATGTAINKRAKSYASMFIRGDNPFTDIVTENKNGRKLLIFKESYGNAFVPYMIDYFEEIVVIDSRYSTASVSKVIEKYGITDALVINNIQAVSSQQKILKKRLAS